MTFTGKCIGGPHDGQMMEHWSKRKKFFRPTITSLLNDEIRTIEIGEYRLNDFGIWHWWPTEEGRALEVLDKSEMDT